MNTNKINLQQILADASRLIKSAGDSTLSYFKKYQEISIQETDARIQIKDDNSPVTEADISTEKWLRKELSALYPSFGFLGEEFGADLRGDYSWVIDPIDGTRSFITGVPLYTTLLGLIDTDTRVPVAGFIYAPVTKELVCAAAHMGAWYNERRIEKTLSAKVAPRDWAHATIVSYDWHKVCEKSSTLFEYTNKADTKRTWGDGFGYLLLVTGRCQAVIDPDMHLWDIMPVYPIIKEVGSCAGTWSGEEIDWYADSLDTIACSSQNMLKEIQSHV